MTSPNLSISNLAVEALSDKKCRTRDFFETAFKHIVVPYAKQAANESDAAKRMPIILTSLFEFIHDDMQSIEYCVRGQELLNVLSQNAPLGYSYLFASPLILNYNIVTPLIEWWLDSKNHMYTHAFDIASEAAFTGKHKDACYALPGILSLRRTMMMPPHLFGELSKHSQGVSILTQYIPSLLQCLQSKSTNDQRRAFFALAHFASSPLTTKIVSENDIAGKMLDAALTSKSLVLRGTLVSCFSIFAQSDYFTKFLIEHDFEVCKYGTHSSVVPCDPYTFVVRTEHTDKLSLSDVRVPPGHESVCDVLMGLLSPLTSNQSKQTLANYKKEMYDPEVACFTHQILGEYPFPEDVCRQLEQITVNVPLRSFDVCEYEKCCDQRVLAEAKARLSALANIGFKDPEGMREFPIPVCNTVDEILQFKNVQCCCECFASDELIKKMTGLTRDQLYGLSMDELEKMRCKILLKNSS